MMGGTIKSGSIEVPMRQALENICVAQDGDVYRAIIAAVDEADSKGEDPRKVIEQVILALVICAMSYELSLKVVKRCIDIYRLAVLHLARASDDIAEA